MVLIEGERQTGEYLQIKLKEVLAAWALEGKVIAATTDQGANMKKCLSLYQQETSNVAWIATHPNAMLILAEEQKVLFGKSYKLLAMNHTRWNSKYVMIARVVKVSPAFEKAYRRMLAAHNDQRANALTLKKLIPSGEEVAILNELIRLLQGAANFTHWVGQLENPTISQVYPRIEGILPAIDTFVTDGPREMHQQLEKDPSYGKLDMWNTPLPADARLPPAFEVTDMVFRMLNGRSDPSTYLCKAKYLVVAEIIRLQEEDAERSAQNRQDSQVSTPSRQKRFHSGPIQTLVRRRMNAAMIVQDYCEQIAAEENDFSEFADLPLDYWNERQEDPEAAYLIRVARAYLGIPATSSESERSFSRAGRILGTNRCRMLHTTFRNLMRNHSFNKFFCRFPHYLNPGYLYWH
ncbi:hypothetical protein EC957_008622 [Mortierella hygrophila]|uniref:HAT C-terminal dimerisation domain-containing protein n=1 Tax=Mortierella hygrophila TaxID=979708 RepID=A0A9P6EXF0_9FUNG|nr:hypothetical protein EC957_008622 [Mortierella hygrophila]